MLVSFDLLSLFPLLSPALSVHSADRHSEGPWPGGVRGPHARRLSTTGGDYHVDLTAEYCLTHKAMEETAEDTGRKHHQPYSR